MPERSAMPRTGILIVGHGSSEQASNLEFEQLVEHVRARHLQSEVALPVRVLPGATLLDELLPPVLEPAKQLGAIIKTANSTAADVICDRGKRIRESKRILEGRRKEKASWRWAWTLYRGARFLCL
jgi:hypothetical protein